MAKKTFNSPKITLDEVSQEFDLKKLFGVDLDAPELMEYIGERIIEKIRERTLDGKGINGKNLKKPYSESYSKTPEFKAFGKSKSNVNMTLSGDMLGLMQIIEAEDGKIKIGWDDPEQTAKAYNHNAGDTLPKRPFFGLNNTETKELVRELRPEIKKAIEIKERDGDSAFDKFASRLLEEIDGEDS